MITGPEGPGRQTWSTFHCFCRSPRRQQGLHPGQNYLDYDFAIPCLIIHPDGGVKTAARAGVENVEDILDYLTNPDWWEKDV